MKIQKIHRTTLFGIFSVFAMMSISTSALCIYTVDTHLSEEYETNSAGIAKTIADASVDILLNRDLSTLQSLIDQFIDIQGVSYVYITDEHGAFLAHTFVPGVPSEISNGPRSHSETIDRTIAGMGDFVEVSSPILGGVAGSVHLGMDTGLIALKIQQAVGRQVYLISCIFLLGVLVATWLMYRSGKQVDSLLTFAMGLAKKSPMDDKVKRVLERHDEIGTLAQLFEYFSSLRNDAPPKEDTSQR